MEEDRILFVEDGEKKEKNLIFETNDDYKNDSEIITKAPDWDITPPFEINRGENEL